MHEHTETPATVPTPGPPEATHHRICPLCEACCGLEVKVRGAEVISIRGHDADVFSAGYICPKGVALKDLHEDPDRLRTPLIKRDGVFVEATWDEAFAEIERRLPPLLAAHGKDSVAVMAGNPSAHKIGLLLYFPRLARALGTRNVFSASTLDQMPKQLSWAGRTDLFDEARDALTGCLRHADLTDGELRLVPFLALGRV